MLSLLLVKNCLDNQKFSFYQDGVKKLRPYQKVDIRNVLKKIFLGNLSVVSEKQDKCFHHDTYLMEKR